jgi:hypothetical protein
MRSERVKEIAQATEICVGRAAAAEINEVGNKLTGVPGIADITRPAPRKA